MFCCMYTIIFIIILRTLAVKVIVYKSKSTKYFLQLLSITHTSDLKFKWYSIKIFFSRLTMEKKDEYIQNTVF